MVFVQTEVISSHLVSNEIYFWYFPQTKRTQFKINISIDHFTKLNNNDTKIYGKNDATNFN